MAAVSRALASWQVPPGTPAPVATTPAERGAPKSSVGGTTYLLDQPAQPQAVVMLAEPGIRLGDDDVHALDILSSALNGLGGARRLL